MVQSDKGEIEISSVPVKNLETLVKGISDFTFNFFRQIHGRGDNVFYSPYSISLALALTYTGARGETAKQMAAALHFDLSQDDLHSTFNTLSWAIKNRVKAVGHNSTSGLIIKVSNALWCQQGFSFQREYLNRLAQNYESGIREVDFNLPEKACNEINHWVAEQTDQKIRDLISTGMLNPFTRMVLTNAIYFKAAWHSPFNKRFTEKGFFNLLNGKSIQTDMMHGSNTLPYLRGDIYQAVELPYTGQETSMLILLPDVGRYDDFERSLNAAEVNLIGFKLEEYQVELSLPKFKIEKSISLNDALSALGMTDAFDPTRANFSGMTGNTDLFLREGYHKTYVGVNEIGTEAAASMVFITLGGSPESVGHVIFTVDRPFLFLIRDKPSGMILFMGRVLDPR